MSGVEAIGARVARIEQRIAEIRRRFGAPEAGGARFERELEQATWQQRFRSAGPTVWDSAIIGQALNNGLDPGLLRAVMLAESGGDPTAISEAGAEGLMQLMPETSSALGVRNPFDPAQSLSGGARYLRSLLDRFGGDVTRALAAYNAGPGAVERYGGVPPYAETKSYVDRVLGLIASEAGSVGGTLSP